MIQPAPVRVLVTGSRTWDDAAAVDAVVLEAWHDATQAADADRPFVVVHGACPRGADALAHAWAERHLGSVTVETHPADWDQHGKAAGFIRNQHMVDLGADLCLAFLRNGSSGASHTAARAAEAGIPVRRFTA